MVSEEYRAVDIVVFESFVDMFVLFSFVFHHLNYANVFYYYAKAILPDDLGDLLWDFDLHRVLVIALMGMHSVGVLVGCFFTKVESNSSDVFSGIGSWVKYGVAVFVFFIVFVVLTPLGSLVVGDDVDVISSCFDSNEFDRFGFLFV